jgi:hypothetical protein
VSGEVALSTAGGCVKLRRASGVRGRRDTARGRRESRWLRFSRHHVALRDCATEAAECDIYRFELAKRELLEAELVPVCLASAQHARREIQALLDDCSGYADGGSSSSTTLRAVANFEEALSESVRQPATLELVEQLGFMARLEIGRRRQFLDFPQVRSQHQVLMHCDSLLRCTMDGIGAIDRVLSQLLEVPPRLDYESQLARSLLVRKEYARFLASVTGSVPDGHDALNARMGQLGTNIGTLIGSSVYPRMRVGDRLMLRGLQQRVVAWLGLEARDASEARRIISDLERSARMLTTVNFRAELREHDRRCLQRAQTMIATGCGAEEVIAAIRSVEGLDPRLDEVIQSEARPSMDRIASVVSSCLVLVDNPMPVP